MNIDIIKKICNRFVIKICRVGENMWKTGKNIKRLVGALAMGTLMILIVMATSQLANSGDSYTNEIKNVPSNFKNFENWDIMEETITYECGAELIYAEPVSDENALTIIYKYTAYNLNAEPLQNGYYSVPNPRLFPEKRPTIDTRAYPGSMQLKDIDYNGDTLTILNNASPYYWQDITYLDSDHKSFLGRSNFNDCADQYKLYNGACHFDLFVNTMFTGVFLHLQTPNGDNQWYSLSSDFDDKISSVLPREEYTGEYRLDIWDPTGCTGTPTTYYTDSDDNVGSSWHDKASSMSWTGRWTVYKNTNFGGSYLRVGSPSGSITNLGDYNFNNAIDSVQKVN